MEKCDYYHQFGEWIRIKDRLPDKSCYVLVYMPKETKGFDDIMQFYYCGNNEWEDGRGMATSKYYGITHWMPLPQPPTRSIKNDR